MAPTPVLVHAGVASDVHSIMIHIAYLLSLVGGSCLLQALLEKGAGEGGGVHPLCTYTIHPGMSLQIGLSPVTGQVVLKPWEPRGPATAMMWQVMYGMLCLYVVGIHT